jgi:hypothetical protein
MIPEDFGEETTDRGDEDSAIYKEDGEGQIFSERKPRHATENDRGLMVNSSGTDRTSLRKGKTQIDDSKSRSPSKPQT